MTRLLTQRQKIFNSMEVSPCHTGWNKLEKKSLRNLDCDVHTVGTFHIVCYETYFPNCQQRNEGWNQHIVSSLKTLQTSFLKFNDMCPYAL